jgi:glycolate oxidase
MVPDAGSEAERHERHARGERAVRRLFEGVVALEGSISGEHGIGFVKAPYLGLELSREEIALMARVKAAFDPNGILNPGKIFPDV